MGEDGGHDLGDGDVVIAAITSCTNTSNPGVLFGAGLVARKARALGLSVKPWVKTSLAPGSQVVTDYLGAAGLTDDLDALGFNLVGYGCTTCIGNSGPLAEPISDAIGKNDLVAAAVLSGNRNFEGRISPDVRANYLASPPLVVAYALAGTVRRDMVSETARAGHQRPRLPQGRVADRRRDRHDDPRMRDERYVPQPLCARLRRRSPLAGHQDRGRRDLPLEPRLHLRPEPALFRRHDDDRRPDRGYR